MTETRSAPPVLAVSKLCKAYGAVRAVEEVSLEVRRGEIVGLLGPNGAGKTTSINMILGVLEPSGGSILIDGIDLSARRSEAIGRTNFAAVYAPLPGNLTVEQNLRVFGLIYSVPNLRVTGGLAKRNVGSPTSMRGPGAVPGLYATESAMNELAFQLKVDPVKLREMNEPKIDEGLGIPFSSRHYLECMSVGAEKFGWSKRTPDVGSMKQGGLTLGWGMAGAAWIAARFPAQATVQLRHDGTARFESIRAWVHTDIRGWTLAEMIDDPAYERLLAEALTDLANYTDEAGRVSFATPALIATAAKPS